MLLIHNFHQKDEFWSLVWKISLVPVGVGEVGPGVVGQVPGVGGQVYPGVGGQVYPGVGGHVYLGVGGQELIDLALLSDFPLSIFSSVQTNIILFRF